MYILEIFNPDDLKNSVFVLAHAQIDFYVLWIWTKNVSVVTI